MESRPLLLEDNASRQLEDDVSINVYNILIIVIKIVI
jgi:hypothetical protein